MKAIIVLLTSLIYTILTFAQSDTGLPPYESTFPINAYETVNLGNLNILLTVPLRSKEGPIPLSFWLQENVQLERIIAPVNNYQYNGTTAGSLGLGTNVWAGTLSYTSSSGTCRQSGPLYGTTQTVYTISGIIDGSRTVHPIPSVNYDPSGCFAGSSVDVFTVDNTGLELVISSSPILTTVYNRNGQAAALSWIGTRTGYVADTHGNQVQIGSSTWTDPLSSTPVFDSSGLTYTDGTGTQQHISVTNVQGTFLSNLTGCFAPQPQAITLPQTISFPDGSNVQFGWVKDASGNYDGRLSTITIPTGGTYDHHYMGGTNNQGVWCDSTNGITAAQLSIGRGERQADGSEAVWFFDRSKPASDGTITTTVTKPDLSQIVYTFRGVQSPLVIGKIVKDAGGAGIVLDTWNYCYDSVIGSCNANGVSQHPSVIRAYHYVPGIAAPAEVDTHYDTYGNVTEVDRYDFGPTLVDKTISYLGNYNTSTHACDPSPRHIKGMVCMTLNEDASGTILSGKWFTYNTTGDVIQIGNAVGLQKYFTYNANGTLATLKDIDGVQTSFTYTQCNGLLSDSSTIPSETGPVTSHTTWDCNGAVPLTTTDLNGLVTTFTYGDPLYRVTTVHDNGGKADLNYVYGQTSKYSYRNFGTSSVESSVTTVDGLGQVTTTGMFTDSSRQRIDEVSYWHDTNGHLTGMSGACTVSNLGDMCPGTGQALSYTYDGAERLTSKTVFTSPSGMATYTYTNGDVTTTISPAPTGENNKSMQVEYDGLGRKVSECAISSSLPGVGSCGQRVGANGYLTKYTLDPVGRATQISHNAQGGGTPRNTAIRYDQLSRITQKTVPETGTSTFVYDVSSANCDPQIFMAGHLTQSTDAAGNVKCYQYDILGRTYHTYVPAGPNSASTLWSYFYYDGGVGGNGIGRFLNDLTCPAPCGSGSVNMSVGLTYDIYGRVVGTSMQLASLGSGIFNVQASYWDNGALKTLTGIPGVANYSFTVDGEGRPYSAKSGSTTVVSSVTYDAASNPLTVTYGNGDSDTYQWDGASQNTTQYQFKIGSTVKTDTGVLTWNPNGTLQKLAITDNITGADTQTCMTAHDDINRITSFNCGALWNENYAFSTNDAGNVTKSGSLSFAPGYNAANNQLLSPYTYDADGQMLHDATLGQDYTWDGNGYMLSAGAATFVNDAFGHMVQKTASGTTTYYVPSPAGWLGAASSPTAYSFIRVPLPGGATMNYKPGYQLIAHKDWMGSTRLLSTWSNRALYGVLCYGPMGEIYCGTSSNGEFAGAHQDTSTGLDDFDVTRYSGAQGRTVSPGGGANVYVTTNKPL